MYSGHVADVIQTIVIRVESLQPLLLQWADHGILCLVSQGKWRSGLRGFSTHVERAAKHVVFSLHGSRRLGRRSRAHVLVGVELVEGGGRVGKRRHDPLFSWRLLHFKQEALIRKNIDL